MKKALFILATLSLTLPLAAGQHEKKMEKTIVDIASSNDAFSTLVTALDAAGLVDTLAGKGPFTVFAPTNDAFAKLPAGTLEKLLRPENREMLRAVLTYHVVPGRVMASDVVKLSEARSVQGDPIAITVRGGNVMVGAASVTSTDIEASNGVIHVIDSVMLLPSL